MHPPSSLTLSTTHRRSSLKAIRISGQLEKVWANASKTVALSIAPTLDNTQKISGHLSQVSKPVASSIKIIDRTGIYSRRKL